MGEVGGPRHYAGAAPAAASWRCPSCRSVTTTRFEDGCPACGANTPAMNAAAQVEAQASAAPSPVDLAKLTLGTLVDLIKPESVTAYVTLRPYTHAARITIAAALAFAAEQGMGAIPDGLTPGQMLGWGRAILAVEDE